MAFSHISLFFFFLLLFYHTTAQQNFMRYKCQDTFGNYTANSTFKHNLDTLFPTMLSDTSIIDYGFYNMSVGKGLDIVNGIGLCMPDLTVQSCHDCLSNGAQVIIQDCANQKDGIGWYEQCMLRYTDRYIFNKMELGPWFYMNSSVVFGVNEKRFNQTASTLLAKLKKKAASGDSRRKFGAGKANVSSSLTIYALVQCTPDLPSFDCYSCLDDAISLALNNFYGQQARIFYTSCNIRYEDFLFYNPQNLISLDQPPSRSVSPLPSFTTKGKGSKKRRILMETILPIVMSFLLLVIFFGCYISRRRSSLKNKDESGIIKVRNPKSLQMDFDTIKAATGNFSVNNKLGQGGFGAVFKGRLPNGQAIAVKRLSSRNSGQGEVEFKNEAALVARLQHRNLVRFLGFCLHGEEGLLIYELLPNKSLDSFLFDPVKRVHLDWQTRFKVVGGIARGLLYLHEDSRLLVVHRDLKSGNILLDGEMNPKIADFGMAKLLGVDETRGDTSKICGTYGYMPPEYVQQGHFSFKSDVFSFGVLVLEIVTGLRINNYYNAETGETLISYAWRNWLEGTPLNIVDSTMPIVNSSEVLRCINIGLLCVQENIAHRPIMSAVVLMLNSNTITPGVPSRPAFLLDNNVNIDQSNSKATIRVLYSDDSPNEITVSEFEGR